MFSHAFHVCIVCKNTLLCGGNKEYLSIYVFGGRKSKKMQQIPVLMRT